MPVYKPYMDQQGNFYLVKGGDCCLDAIYNPVLESMTQEEADAVALIANEAYQGGRSDALTEIK